MMDLVFFLFHSFSSMARRRHLSRIAVVQVLFERERRNADAVLSLQQNLHELEGAEEDFSFTLLSGVLENEKALRKVVEKYAPDWTWERMDPVSRCVLLVGAYELLFAKDAPPAVVMNESIDIAKEYGTPESGKFVNGVLNTMAKEEGVNVQKES
jgi:N utilization substance protein B